MVQKVQAVPLRSVQGRFKRLGMVATPREYLQHTVRAVGGIFLALLKQLKEVSNGTTESIGAGADLSK